MTRKADQATEPLRDDPRMLAAIELLRRTGMRQFQVRYDDDEEPVVWMAVAVYDEGRFDVGAGASPVLAVFRLCDQLIDGGTCTHCGRPTGFSPDTRQLPLAITICWYQWDPELQTFRRGCEGDA